MIAFLLRRGAYMLLLMALISVLAFFVIELPPGDYLSAYVMALQAAGTHIDDAELAALKHRYGLDQPVYVRYLKWMRGITRGDFGVSFEHNRPVGELVADRIGMTVTVSFSTLLLTYTLAIPLGIYSATHQYSAGDYLFTAVGFIGLGIPSFLLALIVMFVTLQYFGLSVGGLFSPEYMTAPWSVGKVKDLLKHLPVPLLVIGVTNTAGLLRIMRGCLLDELQKPYVTTARAKGLAERQLIFKYPVRIALNPIMSTVGWALPAIFSGQTIIAIVLNLPTVGPLLFRALMSQDMYLAGTIVLLLGALTLIGTLISDILLALLDPRILHAG